jgi:hypothetical protein
MNRSLDQVTRHRRQQIAGACRSFVNGILDLQKEHRSEGISDPRGLARMSKICSKHACRDAVARAADVDRDASRLRKLQMADMIDSVLDSMNVFPDTGLKPPRDVQSP